MATFDTSTEAAVANQTAAASQFNNFVGSFNVLAGGLMHGQQSININADTTDTITAAFGGATSSGDAENWTVVASVLDNTDSSTAALRVDRLKTVERSSGVLTSQVVVTNTATSSRSGTLHLIAMKNTSA